MKIDAQRVVLASRPEKKFAAEMPSSYFKSINSIFLLFLLLSFSISSVFGHPEWMQDINFENEGKSDRRAPEEWSEEKKIIFVNSSISSKNYYLWNGDICFFQHNIDKREVRGHENHKIRRKHRVVETKKIITEMAEAPLEHLFGKPTLKNQSQCTGCERAEIRSKFLETIKGSILSKLGMTQPPNITDRTKPQIGDHVLMMLLKNRHHQPDGLLNVTYEYEELMMEHYTSWSTTKSANINPTNDPDSAEVVIDEEDDYHVRAEKIIAFAQTHPKVRHLPNVLYFEFNEKLRSTRVKRAILWIYFKGKESIAASGNKIQLKVYRTLQRGKGFREVPILEYVEIDSTHVIPYEGGLWINIDHIQIKDLVMEWFRHPPSNLGIVISALDDAGNNIPVVTPPQQNRTALVPFLEVYVTEQRRHRTKRMVGLNCKDSSKEKRCCRYPLIVDFVEFGWDWVIAPKRYEAFYCAGECPLSFLPQHPHTQVSQLARMPDISPCCAPRKLSELQMLYFDQNMNIILGKIPAMKVDRCGCS